MKDLIKKIVGGILVYSPKSVQTAIKEEMEITYWKNVLRKSNGKFYNGHYQEFFTDLFELSKEYFAGKKLLDIGCGPLGSLEWADNAAKRVGVDPLGDRYQKLNKSAQSMEYVRAGAESLPFGDGAFDIVSLFNALDHVENVSNAVNEAQRVVAAGGDILLIVEVDHRPTITEPHYLTEAILDDFDQCEVLSRATFIVNQQHDVYASISEAVERRDSSTPGILCARLRKKPAPSQIN
ncbi:methyltransferase domain-containing protein [Rhodobacteraceae bacterium NNCM2]|nr:methyltransferase domain-containing protein [Coraliihabitans acroporae]